MLDGGPPAQEVIGSAAGEMDGVMITVSHPWRTMLFMGDGCVTRAVTFALDPSPAQMRMLRNYCGAARFSFNWALGQVKDNLATRSVERAGGRSEADRTPSVSWSAYSLRKQFNTVKDDVAPWWRETAKHSFDTGINQAAAALKNWSDSKNGNRQGARVGFPSFRSKRRPMQSVSFVELNHQLSWLNDSRHAVRLMLPQALMRSKDAHTRRLGQQLVWIHTVESTRRLFRLVEQERATIQKVTYSYRGGRWQVSFQVRYKLAQAPVPKPQRQLGDVVGVDGGVKHLATLSRPVAGLTDGDGHVANPKVLVQQLGRLRRLDRRLARCQPASRNRAKLTRQRARLHGQIAKTRALHLHRVSNVLAGSFDLVGVEDLNVKGMSGRRRHLGRAFADVSLAKLRRQLTYKTADHGHRMVVVGRFYPSSKTCSQCSTVKAKLSLHQRIFDCESCGARIDRDINAAYNVAREATRLAGEQLGIGSSDAVAGLRPETRNADSRPYKTNQGNLVAAVA